MVLSGQEVLLVISAFFPGLSGQVLCLTRLSMPLLRKDVTPKSTTASGVFEPPPPCALTCPSTKTYHALIRRTGLSRLIRQRKVPFSLSASISFIEANNFYKYLKEVTLPHIRFHDIRHTFASLLLQQGESLHYVKEQMGHASIQTTVDIYGHIVPGSNRKAVNKLDDDSAGSLRLVSDAD